MFGHVDLPQNPEALVTMEAAGPDPGHSDAIGLGEAQMEARQANSQVEMRLLVRDPTLRPLGLERTIKKREMGQDAVGMLPNG